MDQKKQGWKVAMIGECMVTRPFAMHKEPGFLKIKELMDSADVGYGHLEMNFGEFDKVGFPGRGGTWFASFMLADPNIAKDLRWLGVDMMSTCQNHSCDFGANGILSTIDACHNAGITCAGTGADLEAAREPAYWEGEKGRVALVATSSGNTPNEWANLSKGTIAARPGVNPLRVATKYCVPAEAAEQLKAIGKKLDILKEKGNNHPAHKVEEGEFKYALNDGSAVFCEGDSFGIKTICNKNDLEGNLRSVEEACNWADLVLVAHHSLISEGPRGNLPTSFVRDFAHAVIDAGADMYIGHGWHRTLGMEIYKGKPIFYGVGNFFAQSQFVRQISYDSYETWGHDINKLPSLRPTDEPLHPGMSNRLETWWSSAMMEVQYDENRMVQSVNFYPVEMGRDVSKTAPITRRTGHGTAQHAEGRPMMATGENARKVLERLQICSEPFGTKIEIDGDIGRWHV